jgi:LCP family protein required for cell wall assembly
VLIFATTYVHYLLGMVGRTDPTYDDTLSSEQIATATEDIDPSYTGPIGNPDDYTLVTVPITDLPDDVDDDVINILLVGQDRREGETRQRSDSMILCTFNTVKKTISMTSFLRDTWVYIPGHGNNKLNAAFQYGGFSLLNETMAVNFGVQVDGNVEVDFFGFTDIIDLLGGVDIELTAAEARYMNKNGGFEYNQGENWNLKEGWNHFDGDQALAYARIRKIDGDRQRAARQRTVITALVDKCRNMSLAEMHSAAEYVLPSIITDMSNEEITKYIIELLPMVKELKLHSLTCPVDNETLPHSMWGTTLDLYGYPSSVIECNTALNGRFLRYMLGIQKN